MALMRVSALVGAGIGAVALAGCQGPGSPETHDASSVFADVLELARDSGAHESQITILDRAARAGHVELADVRMALEGTFGCLDKAGITYHEYTEEEAWGMTFVRYDMGVTLGQDVEAAVEVADACTRQYSMYVEILYGSQPAAVALLDEFHNDVVSPHYMACMDKHGVGYDEAASFVELHDAIIDASTGGNDNRGLRECMASLGASY